MNYQEFLENKKIIDIPTGFNVGCHTINPMLFQFQKDIVKWALRRGRAAIFADCGLGKTPMQLEWANQIQKYTKEPILILAPLAVTEQTKQEGQKFRIRVNLCESQKDIINGINITNYEKLDKFNTSIFSGIVLDESSIIKDFTGTTCNEILDLFRKTPYRLACTATPSPNDFMELGTHAEFVGAMTRSEMLSMFFINDTANTGTWRLKGHAQASKFWEWLCSWAVMISKPSDLGYSDDGFILPELRYYEHIIPTQFKGSGFFTEEVSGMNERRQVRNETIDMRCAKAAEIVNINNDKCVLWCGLNAESELLTKIINRVVEITGQQKNEIKSKLMLDFANGKIDRVVTKPKIAGRGMNWQIAHKMVFVGLNDSWEDLYQAVRRLWRFGQTEPVDVYIIIEEREGSVLANIKRKDANAKEMIYQMVQYTKEIMKSELTSLSKTVTNYHPIQEMRIPRWLKEQK